MQPDTATFPIVEALSDSLETMAFISLMPAEPGAPAADCPPDAVRVRIAFTGPTCAAIELLAPRALGALLASNLLACLPDDADAVAHADDVLKELANVTCGRLVAAIGGDETAGYEMGIPELSPVSPEQWPSLAAAATLLDAEGHLIAARVC